jgi:hypothetical protein
MGFPEGLTADLELVYPTVQPVRQVDGTPADMPISLALATLYPPGWMDYACGGRGIETEWRTVQNGGVYDIACSLMGDEYRAMVGGDVGGDQHSATSA